eukprot:CAMPEP_0113302282 /NCGR_PEP_ID=MMETSP0010_2-20120614/3156_1 /TAXON_ID=216773 ORGANISM="Corethron hystrix, Strain 308" /NCGR_SAMPLE_ID=MMETSP0010_2 /ASSEMBLY_ACC=CAM_ASM_000155 /LENGTH=519 /DNA_ID=CAMNT_0000156039 /DNA_START=60 /DNA_END=1619 /DNA_ORIENTATION=- /assembly_acc=CAM_ASM_000155
MSKATTSYGSAFLFSAIASLFLKTDPKIFYVHSFHFGADVAKDVGRHGKVVLGPPTYPPSDAVDGDDGIIGGFFWDAGVDRRRRQALSLLPLTITGLAPAGVFADAGAAVSVPIPSGGMVSSVPNLPVYQQAIRPLSYEVVSTIPPTLEGITSERKRQGVLKSLGSGSGGKQVRGDTGGRNRKSTANLKGVFASAVFLGVGDGPFGNARFGDMGDYKDLKAGMRAGDLAVKCIRDLTAGRSAKLPTAVGLAMVPWTEQEVIDSYLNSSLMEVNNTSQQGHVIIEALKSKTQMSENYIRNVILPVLEYANIQKIPVIALAVDPIDALTVKRSGLQELDLDRRKRYVPDIPGFIATTDDGRFRLYNERVLMRGYVPPLIKKGDALATVSVSSGDGSPGAYFSAKILADEAVASAMYAWTSSQAIAGGLMTVVQDVEDVRFGGGSSLRFPRIWKDLRPDGQITEDAVTTILLDPTAANTLSGSKMLRLNVGTPISSTYQIKVADYIWFSLIPKVNLIPRLMK